MPWTLLAWRMLDCDMLTRVTWDVSEDSGTCIITSWTESFKLPRDILMSVVGLYGTLAYIM